MTLTTAWAFKKAPYSQRYKSCYQLSPAILRANWQLYREARDILYHENLWIFLGVDPDIADVPNAFSGKILPAVTCKRVDAIKSPALVINIRYRPMAHDNLRHFVLGPESIPYLIDCLWKTNNPRYHPGRQLEHVWFMFRLLRSAICTKQQLQKQLLAPFSEVWFCGRVCVSGSGGREFKVEFCNEMKDPSEVFGKLIRITARKLGEGNRALAQNLTSDACYLYDQAYNFHLHQKPRCVTNMIRKASYGWMLLNCVLHVARGLIYSRLYEDAYQILGPIPHNGTPKELQALRYLFCGIIKVAIGSIFHTPRGYQDATSPLDERLQRLNLQDEPRAIQSGGQSDREPCYPGPTCVSRIFLSAVGTIPGLPYPQYPHASTRMERPLPTEPLPAGLLPTKSRISSSSGVRTRPEVYFDFLSEAKYFFCKASRMQTTLDAKYILGREFHALRVRLEGLGHFNVPQFFSSQCEKLFGIFVDGECKVEDEPNGFFIRGKRRKCNEEIFRVLGSDK